MTLEAAKLPVFKLNKVIFINIGANNFNKCSSFYEIKMSLVIIVEPSTPTSLKYENMVAFATPYTANGHFFKLILLFFKIKTR